MGFCRLTTSGCARPGRKNCSTCPLRPGYLRLFGRESLGSHFYQALLARRQQHFSFEAETCLQFEPKHFQQMAGLVCYYNSSKFHYLYVSRDDETGKHLAVMSCEGDVSLDATFPNYAARTPLPEGRDVYLRARINHQRLVFSWSTDREHWKRSSQGTRRQPVVRRGR